VRAQGNRTRRWIPVAVVSAAAAGVLALGPTAADAAPTGPHTTTQAAAAVRQTAQQLTVLDEQIQQAQLQVAAEQKAAADATTRAAAAQAALDAWQPQLRAIAQTGLTASSQSRVAAFLTSTSATDLVQQMTTLDVIASHTEAVLAQVAAAQQAAAGAKAAADAASAKAQASLGTLQQQKKTLQSQASTYQSAYARLTAADQAAVTDSLAGPRLKTPSTGSLPPAPSEAAALIIRTALAQVGKPYVYGSAGPNGFDCSGLTSYAFAAAGIALPHSSLAQSRMGTPVSRADLQPGDLVFFYTPVSHVGLYIGNGMMVHARTFGQPVAVTSVDQSGYVGARRIG
jgi:peptidoglycan DL-endopeptidase CwlO